MTVSSSLEIPRRASYKSSEVCEIAQVKAYVLRSWEAEFPYLGVDKGRGARVYRRGDVQLVLRLKELLFVDGLTLGGARRRLEEERDEVAAEADRSPEALGAPELRQGIEEVKSGLRGILEMLSGNGADRSVAVAPPRKAARVKPARRRKKGAKDSPVMFNV